MAQPGLTWPALPNLAFPVLTWHNQA